MDDIQTILKLVSFAVSWASLLLSTWGAVCFFPRKNDRMDSGPAWLILAVWLTMVGTALNVGYWRVFGDLAVYYDWFTIQEIRAFGNTIGDITWKGLGAIGAYLHFYSRWKFLSRDEQLNWRPLLMVFYPNNTHWAVKSSMFIYRLGRRKD